MVELFAGSRKSIHHLICIKYIYQAFTDVIQDWNYDFIFPINLALCDIINRFNSKAEIQSLTCYLNIEVSETMKTRIN